MHCIAKAHLRAAGFNESVRSAMTYIAGYRCSVAWLPFVPNWFSWLNIFAKRRSDGNQRSKLPDLAHSRRGGIRRFGFTRKLCLRTEARFHPSQARKRLPDDCHLV